MRCPHGNYVWKGCSACEALFSFIRGRVTEVFEAGEKSAMAAAENADGDVIREASRCHQLSEEIISQVYTEMCHVSRK